MRLQTTARLALLFGTVLTLANLSPTQAALIAHYTFDNTNVVGTAGAGDVSGLGNDLSATGSGGGVNILTNQPGVFGQAYQFIFDGTGTATDPTQFENLLRTSGTIMPTGTNPVTISVWFKQTAATAGAQNKLFGYGSSNTDANTATGEALDIGLEGGGIRLRNFNGNTTYGSGLDFLVTNAGWHHLAVRVTNNAVRYHDISIFLDGVKLSVSADAGATNDTLNIPASLLGVGNVGYNASLNFGFTGQLDEMRVYNSALTDVDIQALAVPPPAIIPGVNSLQESTGGARVTSGTGITLSWSVTNAATLTLDPGGINVTGLTNFVVNPTASQTYRLTATSATGQTASRTVPVFVGASVPTPVIHYTLNNADLSGNTVLDSSGSGNNGTLFFTTGVLTGQSGRYAEAFTFLPDSSSANELIDAPAAVVPATNAQRTISLWFRKNAANGSDILFDQGSLSALTVGRAFEISASSTGITINDGAQNLAFGSGFDWVGANAGWHWLAVRVTANAYSFNDVQVFVDGVKLTAASTNGAAINTATAAEGSLVSIGGTHLRTGNNFDFDGSLDDIKIYAAALSDTEIAALAPVLPVISSFTSPTVETRAASHTLTWATTNAVTLTLNPGAINVTGLTSTNVNLTTNTAFTLTATSSTGDIATRTVYLFAGTAPASVVAYTFDNANITGGVTVEDMIANNDATLTSSNSGSFTIGQAGLFAEAVLFTNTSTTNFSVATGPAGVLPSGAAGRTFALWFNQRVLIGQNKMFGYGDPAADAVPPLAGQAFDVGIEGGGIRIRHFGGNITYGSGFDFVGLQAGWHHLAVRVKPATGTFADVDVFVDGVQRAVTATANAGTAQALNTTDSPFGVGNTAIVDSGSQQGFNGLIDGFGAYNGPLSGAEINALVAAAPAVSISLGQASFVAPGTLNLTVTATRLNTPYHLLGSTNLATGFTPISGSTFVPTTAPWPLSVPVTPGVNPQMFIRAASGSTP